MLWLGIVWAMLMNMTNATSSYIHEQYDEEHDVNTLTICDWYDSSKCITMKDRNEWATEAGTGCSATDTWACGYHYQWWNNHWFAPCLDSDWCTSFQNNESYDTNAMDCDWYGPWNRLNTGIFINNWAWYCTPQTQNYNMRWWAIDSLSNNRWYDITWNMAINPTNRKWPCDTWYHVPSISEWSLALKYWAQENEIESRESDGGLKYTTFNGMKFWEDFKIPFAGYRDFNTFVNDIGVHAYLWSSSPIVDSIAARRVSLNQDEASMNYYDYRKNALSVRCFKDSPLSFPSVSDAVKVKVVADGNVLYEWEIAVWSRFFESAELMEILNQDKSKSWWRFLWWYDEVWEEKINFNKAPTENVKIVAKYRSEYVYDKEVNWINTITICDQNWENCITMRDRNEWATKAGRICSFTDRWACGLHYQWWNNYWFDPFAEPISWTAQVDCTNIGPSTYSSSIFIEWFDDWCSSKNDNLWWWSWDSQENNRWLDTINLTSLDRQWPCGSWYHVPSIWERNKVLEYRAVKNDVYLDTNSNWFKYSWQLDSYKFQEDFKIPWAGLRLNGVHLDSSPHLWSSSPDVNYGYIYYIMMYPNARPPYGSSYREGALSVRCFKDSSLVVLKIMDGDEEKNSRVMEIWDELPDDVIERMSAYVNSNPGYTLSGWYDDEAALRWTPEMEVETWFTLRAVWTKNQTEESTSSSNWSHWWGGSTISKDNCPNGDFSDSYYDGTCGTRPQNDKEVSSWMNEEVVESSEEISSLEWQGNNELQTAYEFAYKNWITTMDTIEDADMMWNLNRISMAKMLSKYAINVLWKKPANIVVPQFSDITDELNAKYDYWVTLAYQLWIMWINMPDNKFRPFDLVTRAEFVTALSRLLYDTEDGEILYYSTHMELLNKMWIITVTDPDMKELRWYVMLMLMRSAK